MEKLVDARIGGTFNFYRDGEGAAARAGRLERYLHERRDARILLVGEAPGRIAQSACDGPYVRHPSYGGAAAFRSGVGALING
jgi:hypothetical protein